MKKVDDETPSFLKDEETLKKIEQQRSKGSKLSIKGIPPVINSKYEILKDEADTFFKKKNYQIAAQKYKELLKILQDLSKEELSKFNSTELHFKSNSNFQQLAIYLKHA